MDIAMSEMVIIKIFFAAVIIITLLIAANGFTNKSNKEIVDEEFERSAPSKDAEKEE